MTMSRRQLGKQIRQAREAKGLSLRQAAEQLDLDFSYFHKIETGQNPLGKYARPIAKLLGLNADDLEARTVDKLPRLAPYLRAKYDLDESAIAELEAHFAEVTKGKTRGRT